MSPNRDQFLTIFVIFKEPEFDTLGIMVDQQGLHCLSVGVYAALVNRYVTNIITAYVMTEVSNFGLVMMTQLS